MVYVKMVNYFIFVFYFISFAKKKNKQTNKQTERTEGTPLQLWPITGGPDTTTTTTNNKKTRNIKKHSYTRKLNYNYIQQVIGRDKGRALLYFKQIDLNERGSSQS